MGKLLKEEQSEIHNRWSRLAIKPRSERPIGSLLKQNLWSFADAWSRSRTWLLLLMSSLWTRWCRCRDHTWRLSSASMRNFRKDITAPAGSRTICPMLSAFRRFASYTTTLVASVESLPPTSGIPSIESGREDRGAWCSENEERRSAGRSWEQSSSKNLPTRLWDDENNLRLQSKENGRSYQPILQQCHHGCVGVSSGKWPSRENTRQAGKCRRSPWQGQGHQRAHPGASAATRNIACLSGCEQFCQGTATAEDLFYDLNFPHHP